MRRFLAVILPVSMTLCCLLSPALAAEPDTGFSDVPADAWYAQAVALCAEKGIMVGTGDGVFSPDETLSFNQCLTLALRLYDLLHSEEFEPTSKEERKNAITLTFADSTSLTSYGYHQYQPLPEVENCKFYSDWWQWGSNDGFFQLGLAADGLEPVRDDDTQAAYDAAKAAATAWATAHEGPATLTAGDITLTGTTQCWAPGGYPELAFHAELGDPEEHRAKMAALREAVYDETNTVPKPTPANSRQAGVLPPAPEDWVKPTLTLTLTDGTELTGCGDETVALPGVEGGRFRFGWWGWGMMGVMTRDNLHVTLEPDLEKNFDDPEYQAVWEMLGQWGDALEGPATVTVKDRVISGTVACWFPVKDWGLSFYPDGEDTTEATQFLHDAIYSDVPTANAWWRDGAWYLSQSEELREKSNFLCFLDYDQDASRWDFAQALYEVIGELPILRTVDIPDLERGYRSPAAYHLYEAGILTGVDAYGTFDGEGSFTRAQAAMMVARMLDESLRVSEPLAPLPTEGYALTYLLDGSPDCGVNYPVCVLGNSEENEGHVGVLLLDGTLLPWPGTGTPSWALGPSGDYVYFGVYDETTEDPYDTKAGLMDRKGDFVVPMENGRGQLTYAIEGGFFSELYSADGFPVWTLLDENGQLIREMPVENADPESLYPPKARQPYQGIEDVNGHYYVDANGNPISQKFDWTSHITDDGQGFVGLDGKIYRIEFEKQVPPQRYKGGKQTWLKRRDFSVNSRSSLPVAT